MHDSLLLFVFLGLGAVSKNSISVQSFANIRQITVNPLLSPPGGLFISSPFEAGGLFERGAGGFFILEQYNGISSSQRTRIRRRQAPIQKVLGHAAKDQNQFRSSS